MPKPLILVTNDDGIESPGLLAAVEAISEIGEVIVVAPTKQMTSSGRCFRADKSEHFNRFDMKVNNKNINAFHIDATPALCVCHALLTLLKNRKPDLLISGINYGENLGTNISISGTVGAAIEAACNNIPSIAISLQTPIDFHMKYGEVNWDAAKYFLYEYALEVLSNDLPENVDIYNINIPDTATKNTEIRMTKVSRKPYFYNWLEEGEFESQIGDNILKVNTKDIEPSSDIYALAIDKVVSISPLNIDMSAKR